MKTTVCEVCGKEFKQGASGRRTTCSKACCQYLKGARQKGNADKSRDFELPSAQYIMRAGLAELKRLYRKGKLSAVRLRMELGRRRNSTRFAFADDGVIIHGSMNNMGRIR